MHTDRSLANLSGLEVAAQFGASAARIQANGAILAAMAPSVAVKDALIAAKRMHIPLFEDKGFRALIAKTTVDIEAFKGASSLLQAIQAIQPLQVDLIGAHSRATMEMLRGSLPSVRFAESVSQTLTEAGQLGRLPALFGDYAELRDTILRTGEMAAFLGGLVDTRRYAAELVAPLQSSLRALDIEAASLWTDFSVKGFGFPASSSWLWEAPVVQTYQAAKNLVQIAGAEENEPVVIPDPASPSPESSTIASRLRAVGPEFARVYIAARDALLRKSEDYVRHASVSLRELLDKLLVELAPERDVKDWSPGAKLLAEQPHKARLQYLFRNIGHGPYSRFAEEDINLILQTFYALNSGTHSLEPPFSDEVMSILQARIDGHLLILLTVRGL